MILAIESSCDDSSLAIMKMDNYELIHYEKISQENEHAKYGGVVPELAARLHCKALPDIVKNAKAYFKYLKAVAVTNEPGLSVSLLPGISAASAICLALNLPLVPINHLIGHIYSLFLDSKMKFPLGVLLVSGGHTMIIDINANGEISIIAQSSDDSFGESFDKTAKMLNLSYPGGPIIQELAKKGNSKAYDFTIPLKGTKRLEYSFSGLKNQVRLAIKNSKNLSEDSANIAASFQMTACLHIIDRLKLAFNQQKWQNFGVVGGASANLKLRDELEKLCLQNNCKLFFAPLKFCSDNAAMIARAGISFYKQNQICQNLHIKMQARTNINKMKIFE